MKYRLNRYLGYCLFLIQIACSMDKNETNLQNLPQYKLILKDSIIIHTQASFFPIVDYDTARKTYLAVDILKSRIVEFDDNGEIKLDMREANDEPNGFGTGFVAGVCYYHNQIAILGNKGLYFYNTKGKLESRLLQKGLGATGFGYPRMFFSADEINLIIANAGFIGKYPLIQSKEFYEKFENLMLIDIKNKEFKDIIGFEKTSMLRSSGLFYYNIDPSFVLNKNKLSCIYGVDSHIYQYTIQKGDAVFDKQINLNPEHFGTLKGINFKSEPLNIDEGIRLTFSNPKYQYLFSFDDYFLTQYCTSVSESYLKNVSLNAVDKLKKLRKQYIQIFKDNQKVSKDILLPNKISHITYVHSLDKIIAYHNKENESTEPDTEKFYVYGLVMKK